MRSTFWSRLALALLSVLGVFVPLVDANTRDEVTIDGTRRVQQRPTQPKLLTRAALASADDTANDSRAPHAPSSTTPKRFLLHRAWLN